MEPSFEVLREGPCLELPGGLLVATQLSGPPPAEARAHAFALHGWMDNSASFYALGAALARAGVSLCALDLPGHGRSAHLPAHAFYAQAVYAAHACEAWAAWAAWRWAAPSLAPPAILIGHSLGAGLASAIAGATSAAAAARASDSGEAAAATGPPPAALILLEGLGPPGPRAALSGGSVPGAAGLLARALAAKREALAAGPRSLYASPEAAAAHRQATAARNPGSQYISAEVARALVLRALEPAPAAPAAAAAAAATADGDGTPATGSGWVFTHDPKVKGSSPHFFTEEQAQQLLAAVSCPTLLLLAADGWPRPADLMQARMRALRDLETRTLPGSHHHHADPDTAPAVAGAVLSFLHARGLL